jgi:DNA-binding transcriptional LysR family regulator
MDSANNQAIVTALYASLGIGFLPESYVKGHIRRGKFKKIDIDGLNSAQKNNLVIHKNKKLNALQQQAYDLVKEIATKDGKESRV